MNFPSSNHSGRRSNRLPKRSIILSLLFLYAYTCFGQDKTIADSVKNSRVLKEVEISSYSKADPIKYPVLQPKALSATIQTVGTEQIQQTGAINVIEALKYTVAGNLSEQGRKRRNFISFRGQSSVDYAIDGISMYSFMDAPNALSSNVVDEIEITRSSNALLTGYSGLNGVVNMKTKTFDHFTTLGEIEYGTFNKIHANLTHGGNIKGLKYVLSISKDKTDGPDNLNAAEDMWNLYGKLQYRFGDKLEATVQHFYMNGMREFAQMQTDKANVAPANAAMIWKFDPLSFHITLGQLKYYESEKATTELQVYYVNSQRNWNKRAYYVAQGTVHEDSIPSYQTIKEPDYVLGGGLFQTFSPVENNVLKLGLMGSKKTTPSQTNPSGTTENTDIRLFSGTLVDEHSFQNLTVNGGIKVMRNYYKKYAPGSSTIYIENEWQPVTVNVNAGASWKCRPDMMVNFLISAGVIDAPTSGSEQNISGTDTTYSAIKNEKRLNMDFGIVKQIKGVGSITLTAFYINRENAYEYTGTLYEDASGIEQEYLNNLNLQTFGIDLIWDSPVYFGMLKANLSATLMRSFEKDGGETTRYKDTPEALLNGSVNLSKYGFTFATYGKYVSRYVGERFVKKVANETYYVGDFVNVDLSLSYNLPTTGYSVYGRVTNVGDVHYSTISPVYSDYGRQFSIGVRAAF
jgi:hypothetical protein